MGLNLEYDNCAFYIQIRLFEFLNLPFAGLILLWLSSSFLTELLRRSFFVSITYHLARFTLTRERTRIYKNHNRLRTTLSVLTIILPILHKHQQNIQPAPKTRTDFCKTLISLCLQVWFCYDYLLVFLLEFWCMVFFLWVIKFLSKENKKYTYCSPGTQAVY